ncbi:hypothetical protein QOT17_008944 [Balamuthia mandrillaris]
MFKRTKAAAAGTGGSHRETRRRDATEVTSPRPNSITPALSSSLSASSLSSSSSQSPTKVSEVSSPQSVTKLELSQTLAEAIAQQAITVRENRKQRIKEIIRRDLCFKDVYKKALEGNADKSYAALYRPLYKYYHDIYRLFLFEELPEEEGEEEGQQTATREERQKSDYYLQKFRGKNRRNEEEDIEWAKRNLLDPQIADQLKKLQRKLRIRNEQKVLISGAKRQVLGKEGLHQVTWESKSEQQLLELFGSRQRAEQIKGLSQEAKRDLVAKIRVQMEELAKLEQEIAFHYAFCTEILKRASDFMVMEDMVIRLRRDAIKYKNEWTESVQKELDHLNEMRDKAEKARQQMDAEEEALFNHSSEHNKTAARKDSEQEPIASETGSGVWSFADLIKEDRQQKRRMETGGGIGGSRARLSPRSLQQSSSSEEGAEPSQESLSALKRLLTPASRGSLLYRPKSQNFHLIHYSLMMAEEEENQQQSNNRKQGEGEGESKAASTLSGTDCQLKKEESRNEEVETTKKEEKLSPVQTPRRRKQDQDVWDTLRRKYGLEQVSGYVDEDGEDDEDDEEPEHPTGKVAGTAGASKRSTAAKRRARRKKRQAKLQEQREREQRELLQTVRLRLEDNPFALGDDGSDSLLGGGSHHSSREQSEFWDMFFFSSASSSSSPPSSSPSSKGGTVLGQPPRKEIARAN